MRRALVSALRLASSAAVVVGRGEMCCLQAPPVSIRASDFAALPQTAAACFCYSLSLSRARSSIVQYAQASATSERVRSLCPPARSTGAWAAIEKEKNKQKKVSRLHSLFAWIRPLATGWTQQT